MRFAWALLLCSALAFGGTSPVRYRCADLLLRMEGGSQRRANVVFLNAIAAALLDHEGAIPPDLLPRLVEAPAMWPYKPHLRRFEDAVLAAYLEQNVELWNDRDARRRYFAQAFDVPEPAVEALIYAYDFETTTLPPRETLRAVFPIAPPRVALPRVPEENLEQLRRRSGHFQHCFSGAATVRRSGFGDSLWWRDVQAHVSLIQSLDGTRHAGHGNGSLDTWLHFHAGRLGGLWGSFVERRQLAFSADAATTYPGTDVRVGGRRHADGFRYHWSTQDGGRVLVLEGLVEAKASAMAAHHWFKQFRKNLRRLLEPGATLRISGQTIAAANIRLRTRDGEVPLEAFRREAGAALRHPGWSDEAFLAAYRERFDAQFFRLHVPRGEAPVFAAPGIAVVEGSHTREEELRAFCQFVSHHLLDVDGDTIFQALSNAGRRLPGEMQRIFHGMSGVKPSADEDARIGNRARWIRRLVDAQIKLGRPLTRADFNDGKTFSADDWSRLVGSGHFQMGGRDEKDAVYPSTQSMLIDFSEALLAEGLPTNMLDFTPRGEPYDPRFAALIQDEAMLQILPFVRTHGRLPDISESPIDWYRLIGGKDYAPRGSHCERRIFDSLEELVYRVKAAAEEEGFRFRLYRSQLITENVSPSMMAIMRQELVDDVLAFAQARGHFPIFSDFNQPPLELDVLSAYRRNQGLFGSLEELAITAHETALRRGQLAHLLSIGFDEPPDAKIRAALQLEAYLRLERQLVLRGDQVLTTQGLKAAAICNYNRLTGTAPYKTGTRQFFRIFDSLEHLRTYMAMKFELRHGRPMAPTRTRR